MKTLTKKINLCLSTVIISFMASCHFGDSVTDVSPANVVDTNLANLIEKSNSFKNLLVGLTNFEDKIRAGKIKILLPESSLESWKNRAVIIQTETERRNILGELFSDPDAVISFAEILNKSFNKEILTKENVKFAMYSDKEILDMYSSSLSKAMNEKYKNARVNSCYGNCSQDLNIASSTAYNGLIVASAGCGALSGTIGGALVCEGIAIWGYYVAWDSAMQTFSSCTDRCNQE